MNISIKKYKDTDELIWDDFVNKECFGTIYHTRKFINYHPKDRFEDHSILIYDKEILICILPCCKRGEIYFSYTGATYGGPVISKKYVDIDNLTLIIDNIFNYYDNKIYFRLANDIYFDESIHILYFLLSRKLKMVPELSWYINTNDDFINKINNKNNKKYLLNELSNNNLQCIITNEEEDYKQFYIILQKNLLTTHNSNPTHTLDEFLNIRNILLDNSFLMLCKDNNNVIFGGVFVIKATKHCWYTFYISRNIDITYRNVSIIYIMYNISLLSKKENVKYVDYGISTENIGENINIGLSKYKQESLGGTSNFRINFIN
jgi:hypothetical protein